MLVSFASHTISLQSWPAEPQMLEFLAKCDAGNVILGADAEGKQSFHSVIVRLGWEGARIFGIGICSETHGLSPTILPWSAPERLIVGLNSEVAGIGFPEAELRFRVPLDSLFMHFLDLRWHNLLLIQHEIGIVALSPEGEVKWKYSKDIITNLRLAEDYLMLEFMDSSSVRLDLRTGSER